MRVDEEREQRGGFDRTKARYQQEVDYSDINRRF